MRVFLKSASMQRLQPMQNPHYGSKIKIPKTMSKATIQIIQNVSVKETLEKTRYIRQMRPFSKSPIMQRLQPMQNPQLGQKLRFQKTCPSPFYKSFTVVLCKKTAPKNTKYSRNDTIFKIAHQAKAIAHAKSSLWVKN